MSDQYLAGIDMNEQQQLALLKSFEPFYDELPRPKRGVFVHFHEIFFPVEYPESPRIMQARTLTEAYVLRASSQFDECFRVVLMNTFLEQFHRDYFERRMPLCLKNPGGSIWLQRT